MEFLVDTEYFAPMTPLHQSSKDFVHNQEILRSIRSHILARRNVLIYGLGQKASAMEIIHANIPKCVCPDHEELSYQCYSVCHRTFLKELWAVLNTISTLCVGVEQKDAQEYERCEVEMKIMKTMIQKYGKPALYSNIDENVFSAETNMRRAGCKTLKKESKLILSPDNILSEHNSKCAVLFFIDGIDSILKEKTSAKLFLQLQKLLHACYMYGKNAEVAPLCRIGSARWFLSVDRSLDVSLSILLSRSLFHNKFSTVNNCVRDGLYIISNFVHLRTCQSNVMQNPADCYGIEELIRTHQSSPNDSFVKSAQLPLPTSPGQLLSNNEPRGFLEEQEVSLVRCFSRTQKLFLRTLLQIYMKASNSASSYSMSLQNMRHQMIGHGFIHPDREFDFLQKELVSHKLMVSTNGGFVLLKPRLLLYSVAQQ